MQVLSRSGEEEPISADRYGGGINMIPVIVEEQWDVRDYIYLAPRIHLYDWDRDGIQEIMVVNNETRAALGFFLTNAFTLRAG